MSFTIPVWLILIFICIGVAWETILITIKFSTNVLYRKRDITLGDVDSRVAVYWLEQYRLNVFDKFDEYYHRPRIETLLNGCKFRTALFNRKEFIKAAKNMGYHNMVVHYYGLEK